MNQFIDQTGRTINLKQFPHRIISLVPSQTELLAALGLSAEVVGITKFCVHPADWFKQKIRVGGTKNINMNVIYQLKPDLIFANKEENVKEQVEELEKHFSVWVSDVNNLDDALNMIEQVGLLTNKQIRATEIVSSIKKSFSNIPIHNPPEPVCYLIWKNPYMTVGGDTFIHSMLQAAGFNNIFSDRKRYPEVTIEDLQKANCKLLFLSSEPFPFRQKHIDELQNFLPDTKIILVDGEMFSWYGSRLSSAPAYFNNLHKALKIG